MSILLYVLCVLLVLCFIRYGLPFIGILLCAIFGEGIDWIDMNPRRSGDFLTRFLAGIAGCLVIFLIVYIGIVLCLN